MASIAYGPLKSLMELISHRDMEGVHDWKDDPYLTIPLPRWRIPNVGRSRLTPN